MGKSDIISTMLESGLIVIIRLPDADQVMPVIDALHEGQINVVEITTNTPKWNQLIPLTKSSYPNMIVGAGTVINSRLAQQAIDAGAEFLVTPNTNNSVIQLANQHDLPIVCGAMTPTEMHDAIQFGADMIKLFPANHLGPEYLKDVAATLPDIPVVPTGGIGPDNLRSWINAGADAFGIGSSIINKGFIRENRLDLITAHGLSLKKVLETARKTDNN